MADPTIPPIPIATYRLQFRNGMTFDRAIDLIPHLTSLGVSHLYASPIFTAVSGSTHGYDVADPNEIDPALGGIDGLRRLSQHLQAAGLGLILDIVPNHMAASLENPYWRDVLKWGQRSRSSAVFDNDWEQTLTLPVLSGPLEDAIKAGDGKLRWQADTAELVFDYLGSPYPLEPSTYPLAICERFRDAELQRLAGDASPVDGSALAAHLSERFRDTSSEAPLVSDVGDIMSVLDRQPWRLMHWRDAAKGLSYRRFFEVTGLVGVRVDDPAVFDTTHRLVVDLVEEGRVQGLRVDHIDGLADPTGYLRRLRDAIGPQTYLVVEKILEGDERLPPEWPVEGTTGYEFIADLAGLLTAESGELDRAWQDVEPEFGEPVAELVHAKRLMVEVNFEGEIATLTRHALDAAQSEERGDVSNETLREAVRALVAGFDVYRTYGTNSGFNDEDNMTLDELFARLGASEPRLQPALTFLRDILFGNVEARSKESAGLFRTRLQHLTGPVLAKSLEDTFFYRYNRLIALNEVGGDPIGGSGDVSRFHRRMLVRSATQPHGLSATATHDTKRGEDARARLYAISEAPGDWIESTGRWRRELAAHVARLEDGPAPEPAVEWLIFQALAGVLPHDFDPADQAEREALLERFLPYVEKALREAKLRTNWTDVNEPYEKAVKDYAAAAISSASFMTDFWHDIEPLFLTGRLNSLTQTLLKLTAPGIPDIYQGTEAEDTSLVDPDNRRLPDYRRLHVPRQEPAGDDFRATKAWLIGQALTLRARHPKLFSHGSYVPLESACKRSGNVVAFARRHEGATLIAAAPRLVHSAIAAGTLLSADYWGDTMLKLPEENMHLSDAMRGEVFQVRGNMLSVAELFRRRPFALLIADLP